MYKRYSTILLLLCAVMTTAMAQNPVKSSVLNDDGTDFNYVAWYNMSIHSGNGYVIASPTEGGDITIDTSAKTFDSTDDYQKWAFVGDATNGYTIYNKGMGMSYVLAASTTITDGNTGGSTPLNMKLSSELDELTDGSMTSLWSFTLTTYKGGHNNVGWFMYETDDSNAYKVNYRSPYLAFWTGGSDAGSTIDFTLVEEVDQIETEITVTSTGTYTRADGSTSSSSNWWANWYSGTYPELTISTTYNDMYKPGRDGCLSIACGSYGADNIVLSMPDGFIITGYTFGYKLYESSSITLTANGESNTVTSSVQTVSVTDQSLSSVTITISGDNKEVVFSDFVVTIAKGTAEESSLAAGYELFAHNDIIKVGSEEGSFTSGNGDSGWNKTWTDTNSILSVSTSSNNMSWPDQSLTSTNNTGYNIDMRTGSALTSTYTISASSGKALNSVKLTLTTTPGSNRQLVVYSSFDDNIYIIAQGASEGSATIELTGIQTSSCTLTMVGPNNKCIATDFEVDVRSVNRIPALTTTSTGRIIAVTDLRPNSLDIGQTTAELKIEERYSDDNGATWSDATAITDISTMTDNNRIICGFGDPAIIGDRNSQKVLLITCSGDISYTSGTTDHRQGMAYFLSEDNGATWSNPVDISDHIYDQLSTIKSAFLTSGRIVQSRYTRVGEYYRLYAALLCRNTSSSNCNYVIYSDDFGQTWTVLGDADTPAVTAEADEAKVDELPNGNVIISSRITGGRKYNIYTFTDAVSAEGSWGETATSNSSNSGVVASGNTCNGAFMILPVTRVSDGTAMHLALQSLPFGSGRYNVGIYYKELAAEDGDYDTPTNFAKDWDGRLQVSDIQSAYSTMTLTADDKIGFAYEEDRYGLDYMISYQNLSIEDITGGAYSLIHTQNVTLDENDICTDQRSEDTNTNIVMMRKMQPDIWNTFCSPADMDADQIAENFGSGASLLQFYDTTNSADGANTYLNFKSVSTITAGKPYMVKLGSDKTSTTNIVVRDTKTINSPSFDGVAGYNLHGTFDKVELAPNTDLYVNSSGTLVKPSATSTDLKGMRAYLSVSSAEALAQLAGAMLGDDSDLTGVEGIETTTGTNGDIYDLQGRKVTDTIKGGVYIQNGRKFIVK